MTVCQPTSFFFFLKVSYTCLMVTDIFSCRKKTEVHLENFPGQEKMLKYLVHSLPVCCHQQHLRTQQLSPSIFSFIRPEKPQHSSGAYCSLPSQASLGNFWRNWVLHSIMMIHVLFPSDKHIITKALATCCSMTKKQASSQGTRCGQ